MEYKLAKDILVSTCYLLQPYCQEGKIKIAGSVRRQVPDVHDVELVLLPKTEMVKTDLFGGEKEVRVDEFKTIVHKLGKVKKGNTDGKMMQIELVENITLELYLPDIFDFFRQYAIRTGSREYSQKVIATGWVKQGWCGSDIGLRKRSDCVEISLPSGAKYWKCVNVLADLPPAWESEQSFFDWIKVKWQQPQNRNL